jgi:hypothetical protein
MNTESLNGANRSSKDSTTRFRQGTKKRPKQENVVAIEAKECSEDCCVVTWKPLAAPEQLRSRK